VAHGFSSCPQKDIETVRILDPSYQFVNIKKEKALRKGKAFFPLNNQEEWPGIDQAKVIRQY
jgi:hypothetical protein